MRHLTGMATLRGLARMVSSTPQVSPASFWAPTSVRTIPRVFIEGVKILPTNFESDLQKIEITLSLQQRLPLVHDSISSNWLSEAGMLSGKYMVFAGICNMRGYAKALFNHPNTAKYTIRNSELNKHRVKKHYLKINRSAVDLSGKADRNGGKVWKKSLTFTYEGRIKDVRNSYIYATAYAIDPQATNKSGVDRSINAMKISSPVVETLLREDRSPLYSYSYVLKENIPALGKRGEIWAGPVHYSRWRPKGLFGCSTRGGLELGKPVCLY